MIAAVFALVLAGPPQADCDPCVFRSVLDERARMITIRLHEDLWVAYDAETCSLYGAWSGGVKLEGAVYDSVHGPQPTAVGPLWLTPEKGPAGPTEPWRAVRTETGEELEVDTEYRGYRLASSPQPGERVQLHWRITLPDGSAVDVRERPSDPVLSGLRLQRAFEVSGLPAGIELRVPSGVWVSGEGRIWGGTPCVVGGHAWAESICRWSLPRQGSQAADLASVDAWMDGEGGPWTVSYVSIVANGLGGFTVLLTPLEREAKRDGDDPSDEESR